MKLTDKQRVWLQRIQNDAGFTSGYYNNISTILRRGVYTEYQRDVLNDAVMKEYATYIKTGYCRYHNK